MPADTAAFSSVQHAGSNSARTHADPHGPLCRMELVSWAAPEPAARPAGRGAHASTGCNLVDASWMPAPETRCLRPEDCAQRLTCRQAVRVLTTMTLATTLQLHVLPMHTRRGTAGIFDRGYASVHVCMCRQGSQVHASAPGTHHPLCLGPRHLTSQHPAATAAVEQQQHRSYCRGHTASLQAHGMAACH